MPASPWRLRLPAARTKFAGDLVNRRARPIERGEAGRLRRFRPTRLASVPARASASIKKRTSNMPSWPMKRTALRTSSKLRLGLGKSRVTADRRSPRGRAAGGPVACWVHADVPRMRPVAPDRRNHCYRKFGINWRVSDTAKAKSAKSTGLTYAPQLSCIRGVPAFVSRPRGIRGRRPGKTSRIDTLTLRPLGWHSRRLRARLWSGSLLAAGVVLIRSSWPRLDRQGELLEASLLKEDGNERQTGNHRDEAQDHRDRRRRWRRQCRQ